MMKSTSFLLAAFASMALAANDVKNVEVVHILETVHVGHPALLNWSPNDNQARDIFRRASNSECRSSARSFLNSLPTPSPKLNSWAIWAPKPTNPCSVYIPSSLSSAMMEYATELVQWAADKEADASKIIEDCNLSVETVALDGNCPSAGTFFFTAANETATERLEPIIASATAAAADKDNAAPSRNAQLGAAVAAAIGVVGFMVPL